ncbi:Bug family tripartite tricarboxylate transporter substrate binding protein [Bradyrhizobium liaoningense]|uniref:Bug family tripartite tricarboxylate transporter substrate binding protein n=1 Tax=Bradyrhizobium liaoningense TaxID=43992 RepID=UPI003D9BE5BD
MAPVAALQRSGAVLAVSNSVPAENVAEFIDHLKSRPSIVNMASSGIGTSIHLSGELFMRLTGVKMQHVPYRGVGSAISDLMAGRVQVIFDTMPSIIPRVVFIESSMPFPTKSYCRGAKRIQYCDTHRQCRFAGCSRPGKARLRPLSWLRHAGNVALPN